MTDEIARIVRTDKGSIPDGNEVELGKCSGYLIEAVEQEVEGR